MYEQASKSIDDTLWKDAGCSSELDYIEQTSWVLFLKYLDDFESERESAALLDGGAYQRILSAEFSWSAWAAPRRPDGALDINAALTGDVLELVAYAKPPVSRSVRAEMAKSKVATLLNQQQREFVDYVLANYVSDGIEELDATRLSRVIEAKYGGVSEARVQLGTAEEIRETFIQMQKFLYEDEAA